jgi:hypothetical protein
MKAKLTPVPAITIAASHFVAVLPAPTFVPSRNPAPWCRTTPNPALNLAPFGRWTLRDKAAQRRLAPH